jgi:cobalt/nickel transport protein
MWHRRCSLVILALALTTQSAAAHYHLLLPASQSAERGKPVQLTLAWGHPFEHQLFDAARPERLVVIDPDGAVTDMTAKLAPTHFGKAGAFAAAFTPTHRGDHAVVCDAAPVWIAEEGFFFHDRVKVVVHGATQVGWDRAAGGPLELVPLTRPYGLEPGVALQAQALAGGKPVAGAVAEVERYNATAMKQEDLPPDEHVTRRVKTDPNGVLTASLHDAGWWAVTVITDGGTRDHDGKPRPVRRRATLWLHVDPKAGPAQK